MNFGAKGRGPVSVTTLILVLAPACAQGVGLDDGGGSGVTVTGTGTASSATDATTSATDPGSSGTADLTTGSGTSTGDETGSSSSGGESSTGEVPPGDDLPHAELYPFDRVHSPISVAVGDAMRAVAIAGDKNPGVFTRIGGTISASNDFLKCLAVDIGIEGLPAEPSLVSTISYFRSVMLNDASNSWSHISAAAMTGWNSDVLVGGMPTPIQAEIDAVQPRFAHLLTGTHDLEKVGPDAIYTFADNLLNTVDALSMQGVVPVLSTIPDRTNYSTLVPRYNGVIRAVAQGRQLPLVDLHLALAPLPMGGLAVDGADLSVFVSAMENRPCFFGEAALQFGYNKHNLEALRGLDRACQVVIDGTESLDDPGPMLLGTGTAADPIRIPGLPFVDLRSTADSPSDSVDKYGGTCDGDADKSGPERFYRLDVKEQVTVRVQLFDRNAVNVDLHVLSGVDPGTCVKSHDQEISGPLPPGTYYIAIDSGGAGTEGEYALVILLE